MLRDKVHLQCRQV